MFYVLGGFSPHYSIDRLETNGGELVFSCEDGRKEEWLLLERKITGPFSCP
ncbi:MAG: hypothetical protein R2764_00345 [Bacteroidales bacterium]